MTEYLTDNLSNFELSREEGIQSILTLINLIPDPAIIYHREQDVIFTANNPLYLLTNLGESDFIGKPINTLLPGISDTDPISGHNQQAFLRHKKQPLIPVIVRIFTLTHANDNLLLTFHPESIEPTKPPPPIDHTLLLEKLLDLIQTSEGQDIKLTLQQVLQHSSALLEADLVCLYKASGSRPQLVQYVANDESKAAELPNVLTSEDLANSHSPAIWHHETPAKNHIERTAASAGFSYLCVVPLGHDSANFGLFVAGSKEEGINPNTLPLAKVIAAHIAGMMEDQITINNLRNLSGKIKQVVKIQNEIITSLDEGVIILAPDLTIAEINPAAESILGYANVEALRQHIDSILIGSDSLNSAFSSAQQGIPTLTAREFTLHHRNGKSFPAQLMINPVMSNGQMLAIIILLRDLSQEEQSQDARKQLEQRAILGEVTAIFAHEVRNPINAIMLSLQVMEDNLVDDEENLKWIENIRDECNKLLYLMESVLSFAKPLEYKMSRVDMEEMISHILDRWRPRLLKLNITPYFETEVDNANVEGDPRALEQVITNLISNSVNAMSDKGGSLGIKISETERQEDAKFLEITFTDTGHGIPDEIKAHMFKPFVTGSNHGTGLGLAITQRIINAHKGKIEVDSFTGGTIFRIFLTKMKGNLDH